MADNLAYLAARVTLRNGADYYIIVNDKMERATTYDPLGSGGPAGYVQCCRPGGVTSHEYEAKAEIIIHKGPMPENDRDAHDARQVIEDLAPLIGSSSRRGVY